MWGCNWPLAACADQLEEDSCAEVVQRQVAHLADDENLGGDVDTHVAIEPLFAVSAAQVLANYIRDDRPNSGAIKEAGDRFEENSGARLKRGIHLRVA